jgi:signal transduction histidine kinase
MNVEEWTEAMNEFENLDLAREYQRNDQRMPEPDEDRFRMVMERMGKFGPEDELNCGACGYDTCRKHAIAICRGLAENEMCLPHTIEQLKTTIKELGLSNKRLASVQEALIQSEKLASMGQLAAGIAHEVNNPLGIVLMYAHFLLEECGEDAAFSDDVKMIAEQAARCKTIVSGLLHFARQNKVVFQNTELAELLRNTTSTVDVPAGIEVKIDCPRPVKAEVDSDQIIQVLTNLITNAVAAMGERGALTVGVAENDGRAVIRVSDTGCGIAEQNRAKIFEPFFTTKQIGKGTGLGLAVSYGIVKMHRGDIDFESNTDASNGPAGTTFTVSLPLVAAEAEDWLTEEVTDGEDIAG